MTTATPADSPETPVVDAPAADNVTSGEAAGPTAGSGVGIQGDLHTPETAVVDGPGGLAVYAVADPGSTSLDPPTPETAFLERGVILGTEAVRSIAAQLAASGVGVLRLWVREKFACKLEADRIKVRYSADARNAAPRLFPAAEVSKQFHSAGYCSHPARHMPRCLSRFLIEGHVLLVEENHLDVDG